MQSKSLTFTQVCKNSKFKIKVCKWSETNTSALILDWEFPWVCQCLLHFKNTDLWNMYERQNVQFYIHLRLSVLRSCDLPCIRKEWHIQSIYKIYMNLYPVCKHKHNIALICGFQLKYMSPLPPTCQSRWLQWESQSGHQGLWHGWLYPNYIGR